MSKSNLSDLNFRLTLSEVEKMSKDEQDNIKYACQTDLRFLLNCVLRPSNAKKFIPLKESVHGAIVDHLPQCNPDKDILEWEERDEFVILASRGILKSTIGAAFLTQAILAAPDIRILILSGKLDKAASILDVARRPFISNPIIRKLFPEWSVDPEATQVEEFWNPARNPELGYRDATISIASFDSVMAGGHYELILFDDATNEQNSQNLENCEKTHGKYDDTDELLEPGGLKIFLGTKWFSEDLPEYIRKKGEEEKEKSGNETLSYFVLPAWTLKRDGTPRQILERENREKNGQLVPEDVILTWPEKLTAKFLFKKYRKNRADFYKQYLLDASLEEVPHSFSEAVLNRQFTSPNDLNFVPPHDRAVVIHWDLAGAFTGRRKKSETDFSCGVIAVFQHSTMKMWIVQVVLAHFNNGTDVSNAVVSLYRIAEHYGPVVGHSMEDAVSVRYLNDQIMQVVRETRKPTDKPFRELTWELPDNKPNAKNSRIANLASDMNKGHVFVMANVGFVDDVRAQFEKWTIDAKRRKDDAPDCIAQVWQHYRPLILPKTITSLQAGEPILMFEPELPGAVQSEQEIESSYDQETQQSVAKEIMDSMNPYANIR